MKQATPLRDIEPRREETQLHGRPISYLTAGEGPVLLLIHGIASDSEAWRAALPLLARGADRDRPRPTGPWSLGQGARRLLSGVSREHAP